MESIENGAAMHGIDPNGIVEDLNKLPESEDVKADADL